MEDKHSWNKAWLPSFKNLEAERQRKRHSLVYKSIGKMPRIPQSFVTARPRTSSDAVEKEVTHLTPRDSASEEPRARKTKKGSISFADYDRNTLPERQSKEIRDSLKLPYIQLSKISRRSFKMRQLWVKAFNFIRITIRCAKYLEKRRQIKRKRSVKLRKNIMQAELSYKIWNLWMKAFRIIRIALRVTKRMAIWSLEIELTLKTFTDYVYQEDQFDKKIQASKKKVGSTVKEATLSQKAQAIMLLSPSERTVEDCSVVMFNLQCFENFRLYSLDIQRNIVLRGHFFALPPGRVLTRQGHIAQNWYFVVSGQGLVRKTMKREAPYKATVDILTKGMTFGESDIEQGTRRKVTVMSRKTLHLISLSKADYLSVFSKTIKQRGCNEHLNFLRNIHFMKYWPMERLLNRSLLCYQAYFRINDVVVENSKDANTICIIRSGQCVLNMYVEATTASWKDSQLTDAPLSNTIWKTELTNNKWKKETRNEKEKGMKQESTWPLPSCREKELRPRLNKTSSPPSSKLRRKSYTVNSNPVYIEIQTLSAGDVFGLENIQVPGIKEEICDSKLCLVSLGAEVILLSKSFYLAHWNVSCQQQVLIHKPSCPTMEAVQRQYRQHLAWDLYTKKTRDEFLEDLTNKGLNHLGIYVDTRYVPSSLQLQTAD